MQLEQIDAKEHGKMVRKARQWSKRNHHQLIVDMIRLCSNGEVKKTDIMYGMKMSYSQLERYLKLCVGSGLLKWTGLSFFATEKGLEFVAQMEQANALLRDEMSLVSPT
jgi:predicted transcriptional regulator